MTWAMIVLGIAFSLVALAILTAQTILPFMRRRLSLPWFSLGVTELALSVAFWLTVAAAINIGWR